MENIYTRLRTLFLVLIALITAGSAAYQIFVLAPQKRCERAGNWWDPKKHTCAYPVDITKITGRPLGSPPVTPGAKAPAAPAAPAAARP
jgi:hypothetical protein